MDDTAVLYVIELKPDKDPNAQWYVGITDDTDRRFGQHRDGPGAIWTKRNTIVEEYPLGQSERRDAKRMENHLTEFLMQEFGVDSTRGGDYTYPSLGNRPDLGDILLPPTVGRLLLNSGNARLAQAAQGNTGIRLSIQDSLQFRSGDEARRWADENLPEGTRFQMTEPGWKRKHRDFSRSEPE